MEQAGDFLNKITPAKIGKVNMPAFVAGGFGGGGGDRKDEGNSGRTEERIDFDFATGKTTTTDDRPPSPGPPVFRIEDDDDEE